MTQALQPATIAIGDLVAHPANVRINSPESYTSENITHLKASIAVLGLLQPLLLVTQEDMMQRRLLTLSAPPPLHLRGQEGLEEVKL